MNDHLAASLSSRLGMDGVMRFGTFGECIYAERNDVLHLFRPKSKRPVGGGPSDRVLLGDIGFVLKSDGADPAASPRLTAESASLTLCPLMNFPNIVSVSAMCGSDVRAEFVQELHRLISAIPSTVREIHSDLGPDFLDHIRLERVPILARFLRRGPQS